MGIIDERIIERVVFVVEFQNRERQVDAFLHAETFREASSGYIADNHFQWEHIDSFH